MGTLQGQLLVASPSLRDPNFFHSVVLLVKHDDEGAFGLVLNRPTATRVREVWNRVSEEPCETSESIRIGGPIEGPLMALHSDAPWSELEVLPGVYFSTGREQLDQLVVDSDSNVRFYVGYAGWSAGQLESEIDAGAWQTIETDAEQVFGTDDRLWELLNRQLGGSSLLAELGIKHVPADPSLN